MKFDEFISDEIRKKYPYPMYEFYYWEEAGVSGETANSLGFGDKYVFWTTMGDVMAVIKYILVRIDKRSPEDVDYEYIYDKFVTLGVVYSEYIRNAFRDEAVKCMKELVSEFMGETQG